MAGIMVTDFRVRRGFWRHGKTMALVARCGPGSVHALIALWDYATESAPTGELGTISAAQLGAHAMAPMLCPGITAEQFGTALVELGWVDVAEDGSLALHDWLEEQGNIAHCLTNQANGRRPKRKRTASGGGAKPKRTGSETQANQQANGKPRPNQTEPDRTEPDQNTRSAPPAPRHDLEAESLPIIAAWNDLAVQWPDAFEPIEPVHGPPPFTVRTEVARALLRPGVREDLPGVLEALSRRPPRYRQHGRLALTSLLSERHWPRYVSGELLGDGGPKGLAEQAQSDLESIRAIMAEEGADDGNA